MDINAANLATLNVAYNVIFNQQITGTENHIGQLAMRVASSGAGNTYPKLDDMPDMRPWVGSRVLNRLDMTAFTLLNETYEGTVVVPVDSISDDQYGFFDSNIARLAQSAMALPDQLLVKQIKKGFDTAHFDDQFFFDTDHPVEDETGAEVSVSNLQDGSSAPWFVMDLSNPIKPFIFQERLAPVLVAKTSLDDENVFMHDQFVWGTKSRCAVGFGQWQMAYASKAPLTAANFEAADLAMRSMKGEKGRNIPRGRMTLVVGNSNKAAANKILKAQQLENGASNTNYDDMDLIVMNALD